MQKHNEASVWFEGLYKQNEDSHENIPWTKQSVNPLLQTYLEKEKVLKINIKDNVLMGKDASTAMS